METIVLTGGGTAGHIYPLLAVKERLNGKYNFAYIGSYGMESQIIPKEKDIDFYQISAVKLARTLTLKNLLIPFKLLQAIKQAEKILRKLKPCIIFSKGGFVAMPVVIAASKLGFPVISHESDLSFGLANKIILRKCNIMCTAFKQTAEGNEKCVYAGQPIRKKVLQGDKRKILSLAKFDKDKPNLLVIGGSLGANFINEKVWKNLDNLTERFNVVHIAGKQAKDNKHTAKNYIQVDYAENIGDYLAFADIVLSRAGSGAINELLTLRKPMLLIPLSKRCSRGDQIENAKLFKSQNLCDMVEEEDCDDKLFLIKLDNLFKNKEKYKKNMQKMQSFDACDKIIELIEKTKK